MAVTIAELAREHDESCAKAQQGKCSGARNLGSAIQESRPWRSQSLGVHPVQVAERNQRIRQAGIRGAEYRPDGVLETTSTKARKSTLKLFGATDFDSYY